MALVFGVMMSTVTDVVDNLTLGLDLRGGFEVLYEVRPIDDTQEMSRELLLQTQSVLQKRVYELGIYEPEWSLEDDDRIRVRLAGVDNQEEARRFLETEARLSFRDVHDHFMLGGEHLKEGSARVVFNEANRPVVTIELKDPDLFRNVTTELLGQPMVIWLDFDENKHSYAEERLKEQPAYISAPEVKAVLTSTASINSPVWTYEEASELAALLNAGALPVQLEQLTARSVGAKLGEQALDLTVKAGLLGSLAVVVYMLVYYRLQGIVAVISLGVYVYLILLVFQWMNAVLTLPGIAGLVLGIGMAVDANIITGERIKEEIRSGKTIKSSFRSGSRRSFRTIMDANITTMIAASILFYFGDFAIRGFGIMLMITIVLSVLTAVLGSRLLLGWLISTGYFDFKPHWFGVKGDEINELN